MAFTIRNATVANDPQAAPDKVDFDIIAQGLDGEGVVSGCAVTAQATPDMTVAVAAGTVRIGNATVAVTAGNLTIANNTSGNPRFDLVIVNTSGAKSVVAGTTAANPVYPSGAAVTGTSVVLAAVYVPTSPGSITATRVEDKRAVIDMPPDESYQDHGFAGADEAVNYTTARTHRIVLDAATCALTFSGWPAAGFKGQVELIVVHDATTNSRAITWPAAAKFPNATAPFMPTTTANAISRLVATTVDGGTTVWVDLIGNDYG